MKFEEPLRRHPSDQIRLTTVALHVTNFSPVDHVEPDCIDRGIVIYREIVILQPSCRFKSNSIKPPGPLGPGLSTASPDARGWYHQLAELESLGTWICSFYMEAGI